MDYGERTRKIIRTVKQRVADISEDDEYHLRECTDDTLFKIIYETLWVEDNHWYMEMK